MCLIAVPLRNHLKKGTTRNGKRFVAESSREKRSFGRSTAEISRLVDGKKGVTCSSN
jgi:hypothetical protein